MTIYELTAEYMQLLDMLQDESIDPQVIQDTLEGVGGELEDKAESYVIIMKDLESEIEKLKKEEDRLSNRRHSIENNIVRMKRTLQNVMETTGKTKFESEHFKFNIQNNAPSVFIPDENNVPEEFLVWTSKVDKNKVKDYLKEGNNPTWAELQQGQSLRIR